MTKTKTKRAGTVSVSANAKIPKVRRNGSGFSGIEKRQLNVDLPIELWNLLAKQARREMVSKGLLMTVILARHFKKSPTRYAILVDPLNRL